MVPLALHSPEMEWCKEPSPPITVPPSPSSPLAPMRLPKPPLPTFVIIFPTRARRTGRQRDSVPAESVDKETPVGYLKHRLHSSDHFVDCPAHSSSQAHRSSPRLHQSFTFLRLSEI
ncbi:hypothetical protein E2C01_038230 [Portunus trituberculatus]|uniref:Uncharacterized protein n=1 Tax=Portunus trituberculatus TaxID=210409 RepID=A0A5B7FGA0_PORTR|nr:hypothetical protein [Portunus trituberculatus]